MYLLVECSDGSPLVVLHSDGYVHTVVSWAEAWGQESRVLRAAAFVHTEVLTVVFSAARHQ